MKSITYLFVEGIKNLWKNRTMSIASIAVLMSCLLITGIAVLLSVNMETILKDVEGNNSITVYLETKTPKLRVIEIGEVIRQHDNISNCEYIVGSEALQDMMDDMGDDGLLFEELGDILPDSFRITMANLSQYEDTINEISEIPEVDKITDYSYIAEKLSDLEILIRYASIAIISVLAIVSLFIISNTLKVTMFSRRTEIQIMKSVGATNLFIRIPFIVEGILIGAISGGIASSLLCLAYSKLAELIYQLVPFITVININPYLHYVISSYLILGSFFGLMGGVISIGRYLKREGENAVI